MRLKDLLKVMTDGMFITLIINLYGMKFQSRHSVTFYKEKSCCHLFESKIKQMYTNKDSICVELDT